MTGTRKLHKLIATIGCTTLSLTGCAFQGLNSLPLPGAAGRGPGAQVFHLEIANAATLESNSPVMIGDVVVGSVGNVAFSNWHAEIDVSVRPDVVVPANAVASIGQTSLLGSMHVALDPPQGQAPAGRAAPGSVIKASATTYPSTEQTLSALSAVVNGGGLGQIGDIIHSLDTGFSGRGPQFRDLLTRLDTFVGTLDAQRDNIVASIAALNRLAGTFAARRDVITRALQTIPPALDVLNRERPRITTALEKLGVFSDTATRLVNDTQSDLVTNLHNLEPTLRALADVGPGLDAALAFAPVFPLGQDAIDRQVRGDYINLNVILDLSLPRLKRGLLLGTRWGQPGAPLVPAPGEPYYLNYSYDPLGGPSQTPPPATGSDSMAAAPGSPPAMLPTTEPVLPVSPPPMAANAQPTRPDGVGPIFAGPYETARPPTPPSPGGN
jgi:phospholipid/cholesterol/gamma-HCH transport system substrate-binding protein